MTISGIFLSLRVAGYKGIVGGLQSNVFIESLLIEKQKLGYNDVGTGAAAEASVRYHKTHFISSILLTFYRFSMSVCVCVCVRASVQTPIHSDLLT